MSKKKSSIFAELKKFFLRITDKPAYIAYKIQLKEQKIVKKYHKNGYDQKLQAIAAVIRDKKVLNFKHSGHLGDIIYGLALVKELSKTHECHLFFRTDISFGDNYFKHPSGNIMLSNRSLSMLLPLVNSQSYIKSAQKWEGEPIDIDLDLFRDWPFSLNFHTVRWYYHLGGVQGNLNEPFLNVQPHETIKNKIAVVRTFRGRNPLINYQFLSQYNDVVFVGTPDEYEDFRKDVPNCEFYDTKDFLELAQIIKASRIFIANQTFAYALAESLNANRMLEGHPDFPVVYPLGGLGYDFYFQQQFEQFFAEMLRKTE